MKRIQLSGKFLNDNSNYFQTEHLSEKAFDFYIYLLNRFDECMYIYYKGKKRSKDIQKELGFTPEDIEAAIEELIEAGNLVPCGKTLLFSVLQDPLLNLEDPLPEEYFI